MIGTDDIVLSFYQSDDTVGDIQAAAQGIIDQAQAAADVATGAMTTVLDPQFATKATAEAYSPAVAPSTTALRWQAVALCTARMERMSGIW
ncbi:hypothetical protein [Mesorhizobium sp. ISC11]|uniref:hypothetical protein n=1 Tax=Mesorhizobium sp. ISC11 TaxID=3076428 RepID=UPI00301C4A75